MRNVLLSVAACSALLTSAPLPAQERVELEDRPHAIKHGWTFDYDEALATARKTNRPLMVVFRCVP